MNEEHKKCVEGLAHQGPCYHVKRVGAENFEDPPLDAKIYRPTKDVLPDPVAAALMELTDAVKAGLDGITALSRRIDALELRMLEVEHELMDDGDSTQVDG